MKGRDYMSISEIVKATKIPRTTVYNHLNKYLLGRVTMKAFGSTEKSLLKLYQLNEKKK